MNKLYPDYIPLLRFVSVDNTNQEAARNISETQQAVAVEAELQNYGKTTKGNDWEIIKGNLFLSIAAVIKQKAPVVAFEMLLRASLAVGEHLARYIKGDIETGVSYKWPNDVLIQRKKTCGIIVETIDQATVVGIGLNVVSAPKDIANTTFIKKYHDFSLSNLSANLVDEFLNLDSLPLEELMQMWRKRAIYIGEEIDFNANGTIVRGRFIDIADDGALLLKDKHGALKRFYSGSICHT